MILKCFVHDSEMLFNNFEKLSNDFEMFFNDLSSSLNKCWVAEKTTRGGAASPTPLYFFWLPKIFELLLKSFKNISNSLNNL